MKNYLNRVSSFVKITPPALYVMPGTKFTAIEAFALMQSVSLGKNFSYVTIPIACSALFHPREIEALLAHELAHIYHNDSIKKILLFFLDDVLFFFGFFVVLLTMIYTAFSTAQLLLALLIIVLGMSALFTYMAYLPPTLFSRYWKYTETRSDIWAALVAQSPHFLRSALQKGQTALENHLRKEANAKGIPFERVYAKAEHMESQTHPSLKSRIRMLEKVEEIMRQEGTLRR